MARSGQAAVELLLEKGALPRATDSQPVSALPELKAPFVPQSAEAFEAVDLVVLSPGVPTDLPLLDDARRRGIPVIGEVELAGYFLQGPVIGVTGANGKTTTTSLIGHILRENKVPCQVGGNIGTPPAAVIHSSRPDKGNVLESSRCEVAAV